MKKRTTIIPIIFNITNRYKTKIDKKLVDAIYENEELYTKILTKNWPNPDIKAGIRLEELDATRLSIQSYAIAIAKKLLLKERKFGLAVYETQIAKKMLAIETFINKNGYDIEYG